MNFIKESLDIIREDNKYKAVLIYNDISRNGVKYNLEGLDFNNYIKNPVLLYNHKIDEPPIGKVVNIIRESDKILIEFEVVDEKIKKLIDNQVLKAVSISVRPIEYENKGEYIEVIQGEVMEISVVNIPGFPDALIEGVVGLNVHPKNMKICKGAWDKQEALAKAKTFCGDNKNCLRKFFAFVRDDDGAMLFPHHSVTNQGEFCLHERGTMVAMLFCIQKRANISEEDNRKVYEHLAWHYKVHLDREPPPYPDNNIDINYIKEYLDEDHILLSIEENIFTDILKDYIFLR